MVGVGYAALVAPAVPVAFPVDVCGSCDPLFAVAVAIAVPLVAVATAADAIVGLTVALAVAVSARGGSAVAVSVNVVGTDGGGGRASLAVAVALSPVLDTLDTLAGIVDRIVVRRKEIPARRIAARAWRVALLRSSLGRDDGG